MPSTLDIQKIRSRNAIEAIVFAPENTSLTDIKWVDMNGFGSFMATLVRVSGDGDAVFKILANDESDGSGTDVVVKTKTITTQPTTEGDQIHLEIDENEVLKMCDAAGIQGRYISAQVSFDTQLYHDPDVAVIVYTRSNAKREYADMTSDIID